MKKVLFICAGNVARSQMAEAYFNKLTKSSNATSAGVLAYTPSMYGSPIAEVVQVMKEDGIDISNKKVKLVTKQMANSVDEIYILCPEQKVPDYITESPRSILWDIQDPYNSSLENFREIRDVIKKRVSNIL